MKTLYLRIYVTVLMVLGLFALLAGWLAHRHAEAEREQVRAVWSERAAAWGELIENSLPPGTATKEVQREALILWAARLHLPLALDDPEGNRLAASPMFERLAGTPGAQRAMALPMTDGRVLWVLRPPQHRDHGVGPPFGGPQAPEAASAGPVPDSVVREASSLLGAPPPAPPPLAASGAGPSLLDGAPFIATGPQPDGPAPDAEPGPTLAMTVIGRQPPMVMVVPRDDGDGDLDAANRAVEWWRPAWARVLLPSGLIAAMLVLFVAVAAGAWPVVRRLTRRLENLRHGVEAFGAGDLAQRVQTDGKDEVAAVARSFNAAAERIEGLVRANRSLLANASHELRSPLARLKMATSLMPGASAERSQALQAEVHADIRELDELVEEVLLASRLDARASVLREPVDLLALAAESAARHNAELLDSAAVSVAADERLLRRALRNLLENARRYGGSGIVTVQVQQRAGRVVLAVRDHGPGVPADQRERIFEAFYRLPGHAEQAGGVGLGLSLVRQIARRHGGEARCLAPPDGAGGTVFEIELPA